MVKPIPSPPRKNIPINLYLGIIVVLLLAGLWMMAKRPSDKPVVYNEDGEVVLAPHRKEKLDKKLKELEEAEQYALLDIGNGWYPCFNCPDSNVIYLNKGEVWKYGFSTKGKTRYPAAFYKMMRVEYLTQLVGTIEECMQEEIRKIINYPTLPEALARPVILIRPPGNKVDS